MLVGHFKQKIYAFVNSLILLEVCPGLNVSTLLPILCFCLVVIFNHLSHIHTVCTSVNSTLFTTHLDIHSLFPGVWLKEG